MGLLTPIPNNVLTSLLNYFKSRYETKFNAANTATGTDTVTINATSGVAIFTTSCANAPAFTEYVIINSLLISESIVRVDVKSFDGTFCSVVGVNINAGQIKIYISDSTELGGAAPIISFQILG